MRILIADDHPLYREAVVTQVRRLYPEATVDEAASLDEARVLAETPGANYTLFLLDYYMPGMSEAALAQLATQFSKVPIALVSGSADANDVRAVIKAGAKGFVPKTANSDHFAHAIQLLLAGGTSVPTDILMGAGPEAEKSAPWLSQLTPRELDVLRHAARGLSNKEIGRELNLAEVTVKLHLRSIFRKIGARSRAEAAVIATRAGIA